MLSEFECILLAGGSGHGLYPLSDDLPKCMLNVANRPLVSYQLEFLEEAGFEQITILTNERSQAPLSTYLSEGYHGKLKPNVVAFEDGLGTAEALLRLSEKIKTDFIVISGDLIVPQPRAFLHRLADLHRIQEAALTLLTFRKPAPPPTTSTSSSDAQTERSATGSSRSAIYVGVAVPSDRLALFTLAADLDDVLALRKPVLRRLPRIALRSDLVDTHLYIVSRWALNVLPPARMATIESLQGEFVPALVRAQFRAESCARAAALQRRSLMTSIKGAIDASPDASKAGVGGGAGSSSSSSTNTPNDVSDIDDSDDDTGAALNDALKCFVHVLDADHYCRRVNTIDDYIVANQDVANAAAPAGYRPLIPMGKNNFVDASALVDPKTQVGPDCVVGASTTIGEKCSIKKSVIGAHCKIGAQAKIVNSVILDHVTIESGATLHNCVVANSSYVRRDSQLKDCVLGTSVEVAADSELKNELLMSNASTSLL